MDPTIKDLSINDFVILLSHNPDYAEQIHTNKVDLILAGHTHGGQITFFGLWGPFTNSKYGEKYRTGTVKNTLTTVLISNGIGTSIIPFRFFAPPQINIITLRK